VYLQQKVKLTHNDAHRLPFIIILIIIVIIIFILGNQWRH